MSKAIPSDNSFYAWNTESKISAAVAGVGVLTLITGIVLTMLKFSSALSTGLMITGGGAAAVALIYLYCTYSNQKQVAEVKQEFGFVPTPISNSEIMKAGLASKGGANKEPLKPIAQTVLSNWEQAKKDPRTHWKINDLANVLGTSEFVLKQIFAQIKFQVPNDGLIPTRDIQQAFNQIKQEFNI